MSYNKGDNMNNEITLKKSAGGGINRDSNIELLKIVAIFLIVISHVVQTLGTDYGLGTYNDYVIVLGHSTTNITTLILTSLRYFGGLGNDIFFICTAWFMIDRKPRAKKKILTLAFDTWLISIMMLIFVLVFRSGYISAKLFIKSFFPMIFGNNWYISCYIVFCLVHPFLNEIINNSSQQRLFRITAVMSFIYIFINFIGPFLFPSALIIWIAIYFLIAYCKKYVSYMDSISHNVTLILLGILGNAGAILLTNFAGFKISYLTDQLLHWDRNSSPFLLMIALGLFNLFRRRKFKSHMINYISSLSLYIYLFHENPLFATYCRSALWHGIYIRFGHEHILTWVLIYSTALFIAAAIVSMIYQKTEHVVVAKILDRAFPMVKKLYMKAENLVIRAGKVETKA